MLNNTQIWWKEGVTGSHDSLFGAVNSLWARCARIVIWFSAVARVLSLLRSLDTSSVVCPTACSVGSTDTSLKIRLPGHEAGCLPHCSSKAKYLCSYNYCHMYFHGVRGNSITCRNHRFFVELVIMLLIWWISFVGVSEFTRIAEESWSKPELWWQSPP